MTERLRVKSRRIGLRNAKFPGAVGKSLGCEQGSADWRDTPLTKQSATLDADCNETRGKR